MTTEGNSERNSIMKYQEKTSSSSNVLLSVDEILGLVVGDEDDLDDQESDSESPPPPVRSDSLGAVESSHSLSFAFPPPPAQRRAQTWHAMSGSCSNPFHRSKIETNRDYGTANAAAEDDDTMEIDEVSQDGSMTTNFLPLPTICNSSGGVESTTNSAPLK